MIRVFLFLFLFSLPLFSQPSTSSNWYFGSQAGLTFNSGVPVALTNGALSTTEGVATISDFSGNLLFYTNGVTVYDRTHAIMVNGNFLNGDVSSTQSSIIVPVPNSNRYYIFTSDADATTGTNFGICYSEVDMNGNGGFGVVTVNKNISLHAPSSEKLCAVRHCNGVDIWVISRDWGNNIFRCWLVTQAGISVFAWSVSGVTVNGISQASYGQLKASPDGSKLLACYYGFSGSGLNRVELYDFDNQSGFVTNAMNLSTEIGAYGCEFSGNGQVIYIGTNGGNLIQWSISSGVLATIQSTRTVISAAGPFIGSLQRGPDGKIYVARNTTSLSVINSPNITGIACNYTNLSVNLAGRNSRMGLPNFAPLYPPISIGPIQHN
jgi:hypothetical protein